MKKYIYQLVFFLSVCLNAQEKQPETSLEYQQKLNKEFADSTSSPLTVEDLKVFKSLDFYPIDEKYIVEAKFIKAKREKVFEMKTTTTRLPKYKKYGELHFTLEGKTFKLNIYQNIDLIKRPGFKDYLFLPFTDLTCGKESYIGGRYLDARIPKKDVMILDFNKAYNPYCAYNHKYSCPLVPLENDLDVEIKAGVKKFHE